ncbi:uroporphyrinogen-III C-methyltransferase [Pedobacter sp. JY14-1]|uniref:uroporphyrinogen-III C-methyltransferase n=1 Tax=Pedobacter sp. JY14-1 TaxID=3034151 RepID=UPI0023E256A1|nr:uroporphyrinogen-III C-methyltransferase [Pedobacter sp. JY14-1]
MKNLADSGVFIVGGGPGDPDLLTLKAYKVLLRANVVLYDHLINKKMLGLVPKDCKLIYVGKEPYGEYVSQEKIHDLILHYSRRVDVVVRLKGGDPFIFGRGFEEVCFAEQHGIQVHYIPGISSMQASGFSGIPLTHRGLSESVWAITGTKKDGSLSEDLRYAIKSAATVVIYMGMKKLAQIAQVYVEAHLGNLPAAMIQHASLPQQKLVTCDVKDLESAAVRGGMSHPAIIVIGAVVRARDIMTSFLMKAS